MNEIKNYLGNKNILQNHKTSFLCSQKCPASIILKSYDWAIEQRDKGSCIISGFHSKIETDIFYYLLKGTQPIILAEGRCLKKKYNTEITKAIRKNRLLVISPFDKLTTRVTKKTATQRIEFMGALADEILIAYVSPAGKLQKLISKIQDSGKIISTFNVEENIKLIESGIIANDEKTSNGYPE